MVYIIGRDGKLIAMTCRYGYVRQLLEEGRARITGDDPLTVKLTGDGKSGDAADKAGT